jgi:hypothetical protein
MPKGRRLHCDAEDDQVIAEANLLPRERDRAIASHPS